LARRPQGQINKSFLLLFFKKEVLAFASFMTSPALVWFRNDLRLTDNPAVDATAGRPILAVYVLDDEAAGAWRMGGASRWWLHHSLDSLGRDLRARGAGLVLRRGDAAQIIPALAAEVHAARSFEPWMRDLDRKVDAALKAEAVRFRRHLSMSLFAPESIRNKTGGVYGVYTPFSKACFEAGVAKEVLPAPSKIAGIEVESDKLADWALLPTRPDWAGGLREAWEPGEAGAQKRLKRFLAEAVQNYDAARNLPGVTGTSRLSPHVHFGEISPRSVFAAARAAGDGKGVQTFLKELLWREFAIYLLWHHPDLPDAPLRDEFTKFPWAQNDAGLAAWRKGLTGYPIVDAGMRELWRTGWMHNRVRMIVASFLVKHLLIPWQEGEKWFWDCLAEADLAANAASWQWVAGCGADAAPYFRIFNPVLQGKKFDPAGDYVRKFVPELAGLPDEYIHAPWDAPEIVLTNARVTLGDTYPKPVIDLMEGRNRALAAYDKIKG
jgi:deoxyribodipyrimidine photo-lyase